MKTSQLLYSILFLLLIGCNSETGSVEKEKDSYEKTRALLLEKEQKNPVMFLQVHGDNRKNLVGQTVIKGKITNTATVAQYKDVDIKIDFYSETRAMLESDRETIYVSIKPGTSESFKTKYFAPKGTDSVGLTIMGAKLVN